MINSLPTPPTRNNVSEAAMFLAVAAASPGTISVLGTY